MAKKKQAPIKKMRGGGMAAKPKAMPVPPGMRKGGMAKKDEPPGMRRGGGVRGGGRPNRRPDPMPEVQGPYNPVRPPPGFKDGGDAMKAKKKAKPKKKASSGSRVRSSSSKPL
jgi:hypothetical protein